MTYELQSLPQLISQIRSFRGKTLNKTPNLRVFTD